MYPTLTYIGNFAITSFGFSIALALLAGLFIIWRLAIVYELDKEKILDLFLITTALGLIGARALFILEHLANFQNISQIFLINRYPGFNFWGGFIFGTLTLCLFSKRFKLSFWQLADMAIIGLVIGLAIGSLGCLLGSCQYGYPSKLPIAVTQIGLVDKRFPIQLIAASTYLFVFLQLWKGSLKFHFIGQLATKGLIWIGLISLLIDFFRADSTKLIFFLSSNQMYSLGLILLSLICFYRLSKRSITKDLRLIPQSLTDSRTRLKVLVVFRRTWYNFFDGLFSLFLNAGKTLSKINVKPTPKKF